MLGQELCINKNENDFGGGGVAKLVNDKTIKKVATEIVVGVEEVNEAFDDKTIIMRRILKPVGILTLSTIIMIALIKNVIGTEKLVSICENFVKLILL